MGATLRRDAWSTRLGLLALIGLIFISSLVMVALPLAWLWFLSHLDLAYIEIYLLALLGCPALIVAWGWVLLSINRLYLDLAEPNARPVLEASITLAVLIAVLAIVAWMVFLGASGGPTRGPWPS